MISRTGKGKSLAPYVKSTKRSNQVVVSAMLGSLEGLAVTEKGGFS
jgi:hypothetical protein